MADLEILHGQPSADELAAVVVALTPVAMAADDHPDGGGRAGTPAWAHAALLEAVGDTAARRPADLERHPR